MISSIILPMKPVPQHLPSHLILARDEALNLSVAKYRAITAYIDITGITPPTLKYAFLMSRSIKYIQQTA
jgi:hypothetical protein